MSNTEYVLVESDPVVLKQGRDGTPCFLYAGFTEETGWKAYLVTGAPMPVWFDGGLFVPLMVAHNRVETRLFVEPLLLELANDAVMRAYLVEFERALDTGTEEEIQFAVAAVVNHARTMFNNPSEMSRLWND